MDRLEKANAALRLEQAASDRKVDELMNSVLVLQDRVETLKLGLERSSVSAASVRPAKKMEAPKKKIARAAPPPKPKLEPFLVEGDETVTSPVHLSNRDLDRMEQHLKPSEKGAPPEMDDNPDATRAYNGAYQKFEEGKSAEAVKALDDFVVRFPNHAYTDNAVFWIGETHYRDRDFAKAAQAFERVANDFPTGNKVPDALLRAGSCYLRLDKSDEAQRVFRRVIELFPQSVAAKRAQETISQMLSTSTTGRM